MAKGDHIGPAAIRVAPGDVEAVRALAAEQRARLDVVRDNRIWDWLGGAWSGLRDPKAVLHGIWLQLAFVGLAAGALLTAGFTRGPLLWALVAAAALCLLLRQLRFAAPLRRTIRFFRRGVTVPAVVVAHAPIDGVAEGRAHRVTAVLGRGGLDAASLPQLVAVGDRLRRLVAGDEPVPPALRGLVDSVARAAPGDFDGRRTPLPAELGAGDAELVQLEVPLVYLPDGAWTSRLLFVFADPGRRVAGAARVVQSSLWGDAAPSLCAAFPMEVQR